MNFFDALHTSGCDYTANLRPGFKGEGAHLDAPEFLPRGACDDGYSIASIPRNREDAEFFDIYA